MKVKCNAQALRISLSAFLLVAAVVMGVVMPYASKVTYKASYLRRLENVAQMDTQDYWDSSVIFPLSDCVSEEDELSVVVMVRESNLLDEYEAGDKVTGFGEFALYSETASRLRQIITQQKAQMMSELSDRGVMCVAGSEYYTLLSGFELIIKAGDFYATCQALGDGQEIMVSEVYHRSDVQTEDNEDFISETGIFDATNSLYDGSGMVVAVLDAGLEPEHPAFSADRLTSDVLGITYEDVQMAIPQTMASKQCDTLTADDVYISSKIPFGFDYADNDTDITSDYSDHGTHVSGVIAGCDEQITGVAPNAQLVSMKIFSDAPGTSKSSWILSALEDCLILGVDVINMSLGTPCGFSRESDAEVMNHIYDKVRHAGITVVASASNSYSNAYGSEVHGNLPLTSNPDFATVGSPSTYQGVLSVAASENDVLVSGQSPICGPVISDFSSWGPGPCLELKPEITAYGVDVLSAVRNGEYARKSGTSMACSNLSGIAVLLRQYVMENFPDVAEDRVQMTAMVNQLLMSTADIVRDGNGVPCSVRKQGAGLVNYYSAIHTPALITTYGVSEEIMDTAKLEFGDDRLKSGVYRQRFNVKNLGETDLSYFVGAYVMTEGVSETRTISGETTVAEEVYILTDAKVDFDCISGGTLSDDVLTVPAGMNADIWVQISLGEQDKAYLDASFVNGMYVEGYITLSAKFGTEVDLSVPYLGFYGDWNRAPLLDRDYYDVCLNQAPAASYATRPVGIVSDDYATILGGYCFRQAAGDVAIAADKKYISLSNQEDAVHSVKWIWAGLLRNASKVVITVRNDDTGKVIYETAGYDVRKSHMDDGATYIRDTENNQSSIHPAVVDVDFDTIGRRLLNNSHYTVRFEAFTTYGDGGFDTNKHSVFEFPIVMDFTAPTMTEAEFYSKYDDTLKQKRFYVKVGICDNHYSMCAQSGYINSQNNGDSTVTLLGQYMTPICSDPGEISYVTFEITDYLNKIADDTATTKSIVIVSYDYALNRSIFEIGLSDDFVDMYLSSCSE